MFLNENNRVKCEWKEEETNIAHSTLPSYGRCRECDQWENVLLCWTAWAINQTIILPLMSSKNEDFSSSHKNNNSFIRIDVTWHFFGLLEHLRALRWLQNLMCVCVRDRCNILSEERTARTAFIPLFVFFSSFCRSRSILFSNSHIAIEWTIWFCSDTWKNAGKHQYE